MQKQSASVLRGGCFMPGGADAAIAVADTWQKLRTDGKSIFR